MVLQNASLAAEARAAEPGPASIAVRGLAGFFISGLLLAFPGAILPAWGYHLGENYLTIGNFFLSMAAGLLLSAGVTARIRGGNPHLVLSFACGGACIAFAYLALVPPAAEPWWQMIGLLGLGASAGLLNRGVFQAISSMYRQDPAATVTLSGAFFGLGCVVISLLVAGTFYVYTVPSILALIAFIPGFFFVMYVKALVIARRAGPGGRGELKGADVSAYAKGPVGLAQGWRETLAGFRDPVAILLSLLLFFQLGNEWAIAGWLPLFLCKRLGLSPESALLMLSLYWMALLVGRAAAHAALPYVRHGKLLGGGVLAALFGCMILVFTNNSFGATTAILLIGAGFAPCYPIVVGKIGKRFPPYHPGFFNGIFSFGVTGALLAPWSAAFFVERWGVRAAMMLPLAGTVMAAFLVLLIWAESKLADSFKAVPGAK